MISLAHAQTAAPAAADPTGGFMQLLPMILIGRAVLGYWQDVHLLRLALPLIGSFFAIQLVLHLLHPMAQ